MHACNFMPSRRHVHADKARERITGEVVALKRVRFDRSRDGVPVTSIRELRVLQTCPHPNIVALKKVGGGAGRRSAG